MDSAKFKVEKKLEGTQGPLDLHSGHGKSAVVFFDVDIADVGSSSQLEALGSQPRKLRTDDSGTRVDRQLPPRGYSYLKPASEYRGGNTQQQARFIDNGNTLISFVNQLQCRLDFCAVPLTKTFDAISKRF